MTAVEKIAALLADVKVTSWPSPTAARLAVELFAELRNPAVHGRCALCGWPNHPAGNCSRPGCGNSD